MKIDYLPAHRRPWKMLLAMCERRFSGRANSLAGDLRHPSLLAKQYGESKDRWQVRAVRVLIRLWHSRVQ